MPMSVYVKLIHIHFHLNKGEILAVRELNVPPHGKISFLEPMTANVASKVYGCNYIVNDSGDLQAFEYSILNTPPHLPRGGVGWVLPYPTPGLKIGSPPPP